LHYTKQWPKTAKQLFWWY